METTGGRGTGNTVVQTLPIIQWNPRTEMTQTHAHTHRDAHVDMEKRIPTLISISNSEERQGSGGKRTPKRTRTHTKNCFHYRFPGYQYINKRKWKTSFDTRLQIHQYLSDQTHRSILWAVAWIQSDERSVRIYRPGIILWLTFSCTETNALPDAHTHTSATIVASLLFDLDWRINCFLFRGLFTHTNIHTDSITIMYKGHLVTESVHTKLSQYKMKVERMRHCIDINLARLTWEEVVMLWE